MNLETVRILLAKNEEDRQILRLIMASGVFGRPFVAPPGLPADRAAALKTAFDATMVDADFLAEADLLQAEISPVSSATLQQLLIETYATPSHIVERARALLR